MKYLQETGIIIDSFKDMLYVTDGFVGHVDFPKDIIWKLHQAKPGSVYCLTHSHPPGMANISGEDKTTLEGWARALYPFPVRMSVTTQTNGHEFTTTVFLAIYESYEEWLKKGKNTNGRAVTIYREKSKLFTYPQGYTPDGLSPDQLQDFLRKERKTAHITSWETLLLRKSYIDED